MRLDTLGDSVSAVRCSVELLHQVEPGQCDVSRKLPQAGREPHPRSASCRGEEPQPQPVLFRHGPPSFRRPWSRNLALRLRSHSRRALAPARNP